MENDITIRTAHAADAPFLSELLAELGYPAAPEDIPTRLSALTAFPQAIAVVALDGQKVVGIVTAHMFPSIHANEPVAQLTTLVVAKSHCGKGIGSNLVASAELWAAANGAVRMSVASGLWREDSHTFYEHRNYERTGHRFTKTLSREPPVAS